MLFTGAQACVLAFSTVDRDSFEAVESWKKKVKIANILSCHMTHHITHHMTLIHLVSKVMEKTVHKETPYLVKFKCTFWSNSPLQST